MLVMEWAWMRWLGYAKGCSELYRAEQRVRQVYVKIMQVLRSKEGCLGISDFNSLFMREADKGGIVAMLALRFEWKCGGLCPARKRQVAQENGSFFSFVVILSATTAIIGTGIYIYLRKWRISSTTTKTFNPCYDQLDAYARRTASTKRATTAEG